MRTAWVNAVEQNSRPEGIEEPTKTERCNDHKENELHDHCSQREYEEIILEGDKR